MGGFFDALPRSCTNKEDEGDADGEEEGEEEVEEEEREKI